MAFNWQTFTTRAVSGLTFAGIMIAGLLWNQWSFLALFTIIHFGCWREYLRLTEKIHNTAFHAYTKLGLSLLGFGLMLLFCSPLFSINGYGLKENISLPVSVAGFILLLLGIFQKQAIRVKAFGMAALGLLYISLSWGLMIDLYKAYDMVWADRTLTLGPNIVPIVIILSIWVNDTMAYIVGSFIGKTPFSKISPKKTWEGTVGGMILAVLAIGFLFPLLFFPASIQSMYPLLITIASIAAVAGTSGDLLESKLKRMANVKDSGTMMPGHGGFLDRFDSLLIATPFVWLFVKIFVSL